jgi:glycosyltransferase involved in cell wall biosynthesis
MKAPFFSVIIPTYNRAALLQEAMKSVLGQTFADFELIIVDDHSTDTTKDVVASCGDRRVRYLRNDRAGGGAGTRNSGIFRAEGEWIAFLDDDDVWLPRKLERLYGRIRRTAADVGLIYTGYATYDFDRKEELAVILPEKRGSLQKDLLYTNCIGTFTVAAIRAALLRRVGGVDERFPAMQDMELYVRVAGISRVDFVPEKLALVRLNNGDRISLNLAKRLQSGLLFWQKYNVLIKKSLRSRHAPCVKKSGLLLWLFSPGLSWGSFWTYPTS